MDFSCVSKFFSTNDNFLITTHVNPDGDGIGSMAGLTGLFDCIGKKYRVIINDPVPDKLTFLTQSQKFEIFSDDLHDESFNSVIIVDSPGIDRIGPVKKLIGKNAMIMNIDHHEGNEAFGSCNLVFTNLSSSAHIVALIFQEMKIEPDATTASAIYTGITTDTGSFKYENTDAGTLEISAWLAEMGANPHEISKILFAQNSYESTIGRGKMLSSITLHRNNTVAIAELDHEFMDSKIGRKVDTDGFANEVLSIKGVELAFLIREVNGKDCRVNFRAKSDLYDMNKMARKFGGGGHPRASGATIPGRLEEVKSLLLDTIENG
ncbi:MAG: bifunctional oligoribonuclease/PAP phosphatase NrnA [Nitrospinota bacterium]|nr:bifunctional oligoribonuclease/PAP phosphatase NrnA [Nitrospinota bacterium]